MDVKARIVSIDEKLLTMAVLYYMDTELPENCIGPISLPVPVDANGR